MLFRLTVSFVYALVFSALFASAHAGEACVKEAYCNVEISRNAAMENAHNREIGILQPDQVVLRASWVDAQGVKQNVYSVKSTRSFDRMRMIEERQNLFAECEEQLKQYTQLPKCPKKNRSHK